MNKRKQKAVQALLMITLLSGLLSGCQTTENSVKETVEAKTISFSWWGNDPRHLYTMDGVDTFAEENPDIQVDYRYGIWNGYETRNRVFMKSHTEADLMQINYGWLSEYSPDGNGYYDLSTLTDYLDLSGYAQADLNFGTVNGKLNALPIAYNSTVTYYNKDIFDKYNLPIPRTWEDLFTAASVMRGDGIYPLGGVKKHIFMMLIAYFEQTTGKHAFDSSGNCLLGADDIVYMLEFYKKLLDEKVLMPIDKFDRTLLSTGELAGAIFWISDVDNYCASLAEAGTPVLGKYLTDAPDRKPDGWYKKPATMYAISARSEHPDAAARLLNFLVNDKRMAILQGTEKGIPVSRYALDAVRDEGQLESYSATANEQMVAAGDSLKIMLPVMEDDSVIEVFKNNSDAYIYEKATVEEAAKPIYEALCQM